METALVKIEGIGRGYLQHRYDLRPQLAAGISGDLKKKKGTAKSYKDFQDEAVNYLFKNKAGKICLPSIHIDGCLRVSAGQFQIEGRGKKTYKQGMMGLVRIEPDLIVLTPQTYELDIQPVRVQRAGVPRARPLFEEGWQAEFTIIATDETLPIQTVLKILEYAGKNVGIGDFRPRYGQFKLLSVTPKSAR
jgi:hypothetical protein